MDSFYYTNWEDNIYDEFDDYGDRIPTTAIDKEAADANVDGTTKPAHQGRTVTLSLLKLENSIF